MIRMGRSSKTEDKTRETSSLANDQATTAFQYTEPAPDPNKAVSESESMARDIKEGRLSGFVGAGTVLTGETNFQAMLRVDGHLTGKVTSNEGTLIIGSTGQVDANIEVAAAIVNGMVNGDINATEKLELGRTARVVGNVKAPRLVVADGAILEGSCCMIQQKESFDNKIEEQRKQFATNELTPVSVGKTEEKSIEVADSKDDSKDRETADSASA
ncbi:MAG: polymer-forming cytoskeletal protein [Pyrinomonadaceae bacterium]